MNREDYFQRWSELHGGASVRGVVKAWLSVAFVISRPLIALRISPNFLSALGVAAALTTYLTAHHYYAIVFLAISLVSDGIDGTVAIMSGRASKRGAMLDAICDRIGETLWALALYVLGAPAWIIACAWTFAFTQEYCRARIAGLGDYRIDVVTIAERPVRASFLAVALLAYDLKIAAITTLVTVWAIQQAVALATVMRSGFTRLHAVDRVGD